MWDAIKAALDGHAPPLLGYGLLTVNALALRTVARVGLQIVQVGWRLTSHLNKIENRVDLMWEQFCRIFPELADELDVRQRGAAPPSPPAHTGL